MKKSVLRAYARLLARKGLNVKRGQEVIISAELDQPEFVETVVEECYRAGAGRVYVDFTHQPLMRAHVKYASEKALSKTEDWELSRWEHQAAVLPAKLYLLSEDPMGLSGIDREKYAAVKQARSLAVKPIRDRMENKYQWCIAAVPGKAWAKRLFPGMRTAAAIEKLWEAILRASRATSDPERAWEEHNAALAERTAKLNALRLTSLHYEDENGTDFTVGLNPDVIFAAGEEKTEAGVSFNPNIPSEEIFTTPIRGVAEGKVVSTLPLSWGGQLIEDFWFVFRDGKVAEYGAGKNADLLGKLLAMDENAAYLGECALVPYSSPIRQSGVLFYNTLFDENAACHLALGRGFSNLYPGYESLSDEELLARGVNDSVLHEDFMIGSQTMRITGRTEDGREVPIFREGEWAL